MVLSMEVVQAKDATINIMPQTTPSTDMNTRSLERQMSRRLYCTLNLSFSQKGSFSNITCRPAFGGAGRRASAGSTRRSLLLASQAENELANTMTAKQI